MLDGSTCPWRARDLTQSLVSFGKDSRILGLIQSSQIVPVTTNNQVKTYFSKIQKVTPYTCYDLHTPVESYFRCSSQVKSPASQRTEKVTFNRIAASCSKVHESWKVDSRSPIRPGQKRSCIAESLSLKELRHFLNVGQIWPSELHLNKVLCHTYVK